MNTTPKTAVSCGLFVSKTRAPSLAFVPVAFTQTVHADSVKHSPCFLASPSCCQPSAVSDITLISTRTGPWHRLSDVREDWRQPSPGANAPHDPEKPPALLTNHPRHFFR